MEKIEEEPSFKVIVAEDEELILNHIIKNIHQINLGFKVVCAASNGKLALESIEKYSPDILITDIRMPVMDGLALLETVSIHFPYLKTIIISGYSEFEYAKQAIKYGVKDYLLKPLELEELREALEKIRTALQTENSCYGQKVFADCARLRENGHYSAEEIVNAVAQFIKENYTREINLNSLAKSFSFNASYLSKLFKKYRDETPVKYLLTLRINEAKHLLLSEPDLDIKKIGELVGYPDQFYFSRIFKHIAGKSPSEFREDRLGNNFQDIIKD